MKLPMAILLALGCGAFCVYYVVGLFQGEAPTLAFVSGAPYGSGAVSSFSFFLFFAGLAFFATVDLWGHIRDRLSKADCEAEESNGVPNDQIQ
ncbi:hypothetical protein [Oceaniferula spumae]|uniref:hypothetical protein n=1 Tax=Oceaniferula spumae TaxID=2979115 RepID=UPI003F4F138D